MQSFNNKKMYHCKGQSSKIQFNRIYEGLQFWSPCLVTNIICRGEKTSVLSIHSSREGERNRELNYFGPKRTPGSLPRTCWEPTMAAALAEDFCLSPSLAQSLAVANEPLWNDFFFFFLHCIKNFTVDRMPSPFLNRDEKVPLHNSESWKTGELTVKQNPIALSG